MTALVTASMTAYLVLASIVGLLVLLIRGRIPPAMLFTGWAVAYFLLGLVDQKTFLGSFTNPALATLLVLLLVSLVIERSPVLDRLSDLLLRGRQTAAVFRLSGVAVLMSSVLNNTAVVGSLLGMVTTQRRVPASKLLIPLSYASILGGVTTLVGTSTNLVVSSLAVQAGLPALGMFQFSWVGVPIALAGIGVLVFMSRFLPENEGGGGEEGKLAYFLEAQVMPGSSLVGRSIEANRLRRLDGLFLVEVLRGGRLISPVGPDEVLLADDVLIFSGEVGKVQVLQHFDGLHVFGTRVDALLASNLVEVVVSSESELANQTLREVDFRTMFDAAVVGIRRGERQLTGQLGRIPLKVGDSLLLAVGPDFMQRRNLERNFILLSGTPLRPRLTPAQSRFALGGFALAICLSALEWVPLLNGLLVLLGCMLARGLITPAELRRRFPFDLLLVISSALTIAAVLDSSGAARIIAGGMGWLFGDLGVWGAFVGVYLLTMVLTEFITNNAAAALAFPVGLSAAQGFGVDPTPFIMVVAYGASAGFILPFGYQTHLMVYSPGRYRLADFFRAGVPVSIAYSLVTLILVPVFFPFR